MSDSDHDVYEYVEQRTVFEDVIEFSQKNPLQKMNKKAKKGRNCFAQLIVTTSGVKRLDCFTNRQADTLIQVFDFISEVKVASCHHENMVRIEDKDNQCLFIMFRDVFAMEAFLTRCMTPLTDRDVSDDRTERIPRRHTTDRSRPPTTSARRRQHNIAHSAVSPTFTDEVMLNGEYCQINENTPCLEGAKISRPLQCTSNDYTHSNIQDSSPVENIYAVVPDGHIETAVPDESALPDGYVVSKQRYAPNSRSGHQFDRRMNNCIQERTNLQLRSNSPNRRTIEPIEDDERRIFQVTTPPVYDVVPPYDSGEEPLYLNLAEMGIVAQHNRRHGRASQKNL